MPRDGTGVYTYPAGTEGEPDTTIESAKYNAYIADMQNDANNARPIIAGGTGASTVLDARTNLGAMPLGGGTMSGSLTIQPGSGNAALTLTKPASGQSSYVVSYTAANIRWVMSLGNATAETGANAGSDFELIRYSDTGALALGVPLQINRATGAITVAGPTTLNGGTTINGVTTINGTTTQNGETYLTGGDTWLRRSGTPSQGLLHFGNTGVKYLHWTGSGFQFVGGPIQVSGESISAGTSLHATTSIHANTSIHAGTSGHFGTSLSVSGHATLGNATVNGGVLYMNAPNSHYIQSSGGVLNYNGQVVLHSGNYTSYASADTNSYGNYWIHVGDSTFFAFEDGGTPRNDFGAHTMACGFWSGGSSGFGARFRALYYNSPGGYIVAGAAS